MEEKALGIHVNGRVKNVPSNGQRRVVKELLIRFPEVLRLAQSGSSSSGLSGHVLEQFILPRIAGGSTV